MLNKINIYNEHPRTHALENILFIQMSRLLGKLASLKRGIIFQIL